MTAIPANEVTPPSPPGDGGARAIFFAALDPALHAVVSPRWEAQGSTLLALFERLYGDDPRMRGTLATLLREAALAASRRPQPLRALDAARERDPRWFLGADMIGYSTYVDRFAGTMAGVAARVPYLQSLGVRYLHLLPFLQARDGDSDGGFAVRDYDAVEPRLGSNSDLEALAARLREARISLCADFVLNHTADDHRWAQAARAGDARHRDYYLVYPDRELPDRHERTLGQVFPQTAPGNFTHVDGLGWVWTTFYPYQWDLNWANPQVFAEMAATLLRLANRGVEAFRLDSTAYLWKREGSDGMNQPEAHAILQALRALVALIAPGVLLKAEAIVATRELPPYFGGDGVPECHLAYHSSLMAAAWAALAEQRGDIVAHVIEQTPPLPPGCGWISYVRCHDDIGWNVLAHEAQGDARRAGFDLARVARFYSGREPGSWARGRAFQGDDPARVHGSNGMTAALVGIESALEAGDADALALAERRLLLLHGVALAVAGLPLLYMGDELALGNDYGFEQDPARAGEGRWLQRPAMDWARAEASAPGSAHRVHEALRHLVRVRAATPALVADAPMCALPVRNAALLALARMDGFVALFNFSGEVQTFDLPQPLAPGHWRDLLVDREVRFPTTLAPWTMQWLQRG